MEALVVQHNKGNVHSDINARVGNKNSTYEVVEISSDEDEDMGTDQPESSKRPVQRSTSAKHSIVICDDLDKHEDADNDHDLYPDYAIYRGITQSPRTKRQKVVHPPICEALSPLEGDTKHNAANSTSYSEPSNAAKEFTMVDISFDSGADSDGRVNLAFRSAPNKDPELSLQKAKTCHSIVKDSPTVDSRPVRRNNKSELAPYYYDYKLKVRMYRGPGYEKFPIALGTFPEHQNICDHWDLAQTQYKDRLQRRKALQAELMRYINETPHGDDQVEKEDDEDHHLSLNAIELQCLFKLRDVFPDIQREFALEEIRRQIDKCGHGQGEQAQTLPDIDNIITIILERSLGYPTEEKPTKTDEPATDGTGITITWQKDNAKVETYRLDVLSLIEDEFPHVPGNFIRAVVWSKKTLFEAHLYLQELEDAYATTARRDRRYRRSTNSRIATKSTDMSRDRQRKPEKYWINLVNELQASKQQYARNTIRLTEAKNKEVSEEANLQEHKLSGNLIECQCCFDDEVPLNRAISCRAEGMHWFCFACVRSLAENQIGSMKHEMQCMHQSGCEAQLSQEGIFLAISKQLVDKLSFFQQQFEIMSACIEGLEQCPFCEFKAICDPIEEASVFHCHNPDCGKLSCRKCHEDSHIPKTCKENQDDRHISARHQIEEARSEAMMRRCPQCGVKIVKEIGCNKMKCGRCSCVMCYVCQADITSQKDGGYGHFNDSRGKCILYDRNFDRHEAEADEAEKKAIDKVRAEHTDIDEEELRIATGKTKQKPASQVDELGYGWGRDFYQPLAAGPHDAFEAALQDHRRRFEEIYNRVMPAANPRAAYRPLDNFLDQNLAGLGRNGPPTTLRQDWPLRNAQEDLHRTHTAMAQEVHRAHRHVGPIGEQPTLPLMPAAPVIPNMQDQPEIPPINNLPTAIGQPHRQPHGPPHLPPTPMLQPLPYWSKTLRAVRRRQHAGGGVFRGPPRVEAPRHNLLDDPWVEAGGAAAWYRRAMPPPMLRPMQDRHLPMTYPAPLNQYFMDMQGVNQDNHVPTIEQNNPEVAPNADSGDLANAPQLPNLFNWENAIHNRPRVGNGTLGLGFAGIFGQMPMINQPEAGLNDGRPSQDRNMPTNV